eukprot:128364-Pleurochrysis_carterae.AAC.1
MAVGKSLTDVMSHLIAISSVSSGCTKQSATAPSKHASAFKGAPKLLALTTTKRFVRPCAPPPCVSLQP